MHARIRLSRSNACMESAGVRSEQLVQALSSAVPSGKFEVVEADLLVPGSFDSALEGAQYLFHVASPFAIFVEDPQSQLIDPAVQGTRNVLNSAAKHKDTLARVVVTSSVAGGKSFLVGII
jgi:nucleoside-diphosphate-sugar epimerase